MAELPGHVIACLQSGRLAFLAVLVSTGIVFQVLACALFNNWWPMLTDSSSLFSESESSWVDATKFLTGASAVGSIAIPVILKHAGVICWGALALELSSYVVFLLAILCYMGVNSEDAYSMI